MYEYVPRPTFTRIPSTTPKTTLPLIPLGLPTDPTALAAITKQREILASLGVDPSIFNQIDGNTPAPPKVFTQPVVTSAPSSTLKTPVIQNKNIIGTNENDKLLGLSGNDTITGGLGADKLTGGSGADTFIFNSIKETGKTQSTRDTITDFKTSDSDKIDLSGIDANTNKTGDQAFTKLVSGAKFSEKFAAVGQLFFDTNSRILYGNVDDKPEADFSIQLNGVKSLTFKDFIL